VKRKSLRNGWQMVVALCLSIAMFCTPLLAQQAETEIIAEARAAAERDAEMYTNKDLWFCAGCCGGLPGLLISYIYIPSPPASRLIGKSPEYVAYYTDFYKAKAKKIQTKRARDGFLATVAVYVTLYILSYE